jgi:hypothetical protein
MKRPSGIESPALNNNKAIIINTILADEKN